MAFCSNFLIWKCTKINLLSVNWVSLLLLLLLSKMIEEILAPQMMLLPQAKNLNDYKGFSITFYFLLLINNSTKSCKLCTVFGIY